MHVAKFVSGPTGQQEIFWINFQAEKVYWKKSNKNIFGAYTYNTQENLQQFLDIKPTKDIFGEETFIVDIFCHMMMIKSWLMLSRFYYCF